MLFVELLVKVTTKGAVQDDIGEGIKLAVGGLETVIKSVFTAVESHPLSSVTISETV